MAQKRTATTELNHDNWDKEEEPDTSGVFKKAPTTVLAERQIKRATRRLRKPHDDILSPEQEKSVTAAGLFQNLNFSSPAPGSGPNLQSPFITAGGFPIRNLLNIDEPSKYVCKSGPMPLRTSKDTSNSVAATHPYSSTKNNKSGVKTSGTWTVQSTPSTSAMEFPIVSQIKSDEDNKTSADSSKPVSFTSCTSTTVMDMTSPTYSKTNTRDLANSSLVCSSFTTSDNSKLPSDMQPFVNYANQHNVTSKLAVGDTCKLLPQPELKGVGWSSPLKCYLDTRPSLVVPASEILSKIDSRHLLKPIPEEILKRLNEKSDNTGKSLNFLKRVYELNATTLDWLNLLVQDSLTVNIAEVIPSYIQELLKLIAEEIPFQKSKIVEADLIPHQTVLKQMLEVFEQFSFGVDEALLSGSPQPEASSSELSQLGASTSGSSQSEALPSETSQPETLSSKSSQSEAFNRNESHNKPAETMLFLANTSASSHKDPVMLKNAIESGQKVPSESDETEEEPPKVEFTPVVEEGSVCTMKCKVYFKHTDLKTSEETYKDHGVGMLYIKPISCGKAQLIVRADNSLGNILLNVCITAEMPIQIANPKTIMLVCRPQPGDLKPKTVLLRVKTVDDCKLLHEKLTII